MSGPGPGGAAVGQRGPEVAVALFLMAIGLLVVVDSLRVGIGWADDGPRSGYFPFYIGCLLLAASGAVFVHQLVVWARDRAVFAERAQVRQVVAVLVPMTVYVGLIHPLGIYVASLLLIAYFMRRYGAYGWGLVGAVSAGVPIVFFLVFERWFLVPLPKGPLERLLGF
jgi:hypothetical protein